MTRSMIGTIAAVAALFIALGVFPAQPSPMHECIGPGGEDDPACYCPVVPEQGSVPEMPPDCFLSADFAFLDTHHGCCGISGCQNASPCDWEILLEVKSDPGFFCDYSLLVDGNQIGSCSSCGIYRYLIDVSLSCGQSDNYTVKANGILVENETYSCQSCSG